MAPEGGLGDTSNRPPTLFILQLVKFKNKIGHEPARHKIVPLATMPLEAVNPLVLNLALVARCDHVVAGAFQCIGPVECALL